MTLRVKCHQQQKIV